MPLPIRNPRQRPRHLVAAAAPLNRQRDIPANDGRSASWQRRALGYIDIVPELSYSSRFYSRMLRQLKIYPAMIDEWGKEVPITSGPPVEILNQIRDKAGTKHQILGNYGRLMFATGEGYLCGFNLHTEEEYWNFVWNEEIRVERGPDGQVTKLIHLPMGNEGDAIEYDGEQAVAYRLWSSHPRRSGEADAPMRSALDIAEELVILTAAVRSTAVSRTLQGLLLLPSELAPPPIEPLGDEDPLNDPFMADLTAHLVAQKDNAGSAAAAAPYAIWGTAEYLDKIRKVELHNTQNDYLERDLRNEAVIRLARGLDFPPEVLTGLSDSNHWAALQILWDMWRSHGAPAAQQFCDDLNDAYLRPTLRDAGYEDWQHIVTCFDDSDVIARPDRSDDADAAADRGYISAVGYRSLKNIPAEYAPSEEEHDEWLAIKLRDPAIIGIESETPAPSPEQGPPAPGPEGDSGRRTRIVSGVDREVGAAEMALARCRELAGIRIRQKEKICPDCIQRADGSPNSLVPALVGADALLQMQLNPNVLVKGGADTLRGMLNTWGYAGTQAQAISEMVESYAARTLFESRQPLLPSGFAAHFERAKEASHGV